jgi:hypothetical protein
MLIQTQLNIHVRVDDVVEKLAIRYDNVIHKFAPSDDVFLDSVEIPHITLYLTDFRDDAIQDVIAMYATIPLSCLLLLFFMV